MSFRTYIDIANRACQHMGVRSISTTAGFNEDSVQSNEIGSCYDKLRQAELRCNVWRFAARRAVMRPVGVNTMLLDPPLWSSTATYFPGAVVATVDSGFWFSTTQDNTGNAPGGSSKWDAYFGSMTCDPYDSTTTYFAGDLVYIVAANVVRVFLSLVNSNADDPVTPVEWSATDDAGDPQYYFKDQVVTHSSISYQSLIDLNTGNTPNTSPTQWTTTITNGSGSLNWAEISTSLVKLTFAYPIGAGPVQESGTRNVYHLPSGFLREAPQNPKDGNVTFLGGPSGNTYNDWELESDYLITRDVQPIVFRFVADIRNAADMDPMFCEGLAARIAVECVERVTQSNTKYNTIAAAYTTFMGKARAVNGIETSYVEPPEDEFISCRV